MTRLSTFILFLSLFLLVACDSAKRDFMTPSPNEPVLDVNLDEYSLNGTVLGKTATDISAIQDLLIEPLDDGLKKIRVFKQEEALKNKLPVDECTDAKLHVDEDLSFGDFYKIISTMSFEGFWTINYVIGENFKDVFNVKIPKRSNDCICSFFVHQRVAFFRYQYGRQPSKLLLNETEIDCFKDYNALDLMLTFYGSKGDKTYVLSLNEEALKENGSFDGFKFYSFDNLADLWIFIAKIQSKEKTLHKSEQNKHPKCAWDLVGNQMTLFFPKDALMKDIAPLIKGLIAYGFNGDRISFSVAP